MMKKAKTTGQNNRKYTGKKRNASERVVSIICLMLLLTVTLLNDMSAAASGLIIGSVQETETEAPAPNTEKETTVETETTAVSETQSETQPETESEPESETIAETESESETIAETETETGTESETETESESETETETETESESETEKGTTVLTYKGGDYTIEVSYEKEANIPEDAQLKVTEIPQGSDAYQTYVAQSLEILAKQSSEVSSPEELTVSFARYFDISFIADGKEYEPEDAVEVKIRYAQPVELTADETIHTVHFAETQNEPEVLSTNTSVNGTGDVKAVAFTQESFSVTGTVVTGTTVSNLENGNYAIASGSTGRVMVYNANGGTAGNIENGTLTIPSVASANSFLYTVSNSRITIGNNTYTISYENGQYYLSRSGRYLAYVNGSWQTSVRTRTAVTLIKEMQVDLTDILGEKMTFVYHPQNTLSQASDSKKAPKNTVKFTVNLLDKDGKLTTVTPDGSGIPASFTTGSEVTVAELLSRISVKGYTLENGYAFFFWNGNATLSGGMDLNGAAAHSVKTIRNFKMNSDYYGAGAGNYGGTTSSQVYGTIGYTMTQFGSNTLMNPNKSLTGYGNGNGDWNPTIDPDKVFYAYEYGGVLHIVLTPVSEREKYKTNFYNYAETGEKVVDITECHDMEYVNNEWQGKLTMTTKTVSDLKAPAPGYVFKGWYDSQDEQGNGTGTEIKGEEIQKEDKTVYARWEVKSQSTPDTPFIRVQKTFSGITADQIPENFGINIYRDAACTQLAVSLSGSQAAVNGTTLTWTVEELAAGTYYVKETGTDIADKTFTVTVVGGSVDAAGVITVTTQNPTITASAPERITTNSDTVFDITSGYICASLTNNTYFIWTAERLSVGEREALTKAITQNGAGQFGTGKVTTGNSVFYSSADNLRNGIYINNAYIRVSDGKLEFSQKSLWNQVAIGTYSKSQAGNAEIAVTNTYAQLYSMTVNKDWSDTNEQHTDDTVYVGLYKDGIPMEGKVITLSRDNGFMNSFTELEEGNYSVKELREIKTGEAPDFTYNEKGYVGLNQDELMTAANGSDYTVSYGMVGAEDARYVQDIHNTLNISTIEITKADAANPNTKLEGAQFKIEKLLFGSGEQAQYGDCGIANVTTDRNGKASFTGLANGTYRITEVQAPANYMISEKPVIVTVDYKTSTNGIYEITVKNTLLYRLPATGGIGTYWFTITGVVILTTAVWLFFMNLKKRRYQ